MTGGRGDVLGAEKVNNKITPEMIAAGTDVLADYDPEYDRLSDTVFKILRASLARECSAAAIHSQLPLLPK